jgi:CheY-like chemotaxis protein
MPQPPTILIIEDGDEYRANLSRFVRGYTYLQAHNGQDALEILQSTQVDLIYLDMRFDRIPKEHLMGDHAQITQDQNGDPMRGWTYLANNQGLYILAHLRAHDFGDLPVIVAYDFSREQQRFEHLVRLHPNLNWVPDAVRPDEIQDLISRCVADLS